MTKKCAVIKNGTVLDVVILPDGWPKVENAWPVPEGCEVVDCKRAGKNDTYRDGKFYRKQTAKKYDGTEFVHEVDVDNPTRPPLDKPGLKTKIGVELRERRLAQIASSPDGVLALSGDVSAKQRIADEIKKINAEHDQAVVEVDSLKDDDRVGLQTLMERVRGR